MITYERHKNVAIVRIDRHSSRNALDVPHFRDLRDAILRAADEARATVLTGVGSSFCAGVDLTAVYGPDVRTALYDMLTTIVRVDTPVIAAINGPAIGAGTQLALACDLRYAAPTARFAIPTAKLGLAVDPWTIRRLTLLTSGNIARRLLLSADTLTAETALATGLADYPGTLSDALTAATRITNLAPLTLAYSKLALNTVLEPPLTLPAVDTAYEACWTSTDFTEGRTAAHEGRPPHFTGQ